MATNPQNLDALETAVAKLAARHAWDIDDGHGYARWRWSRETRSRYTTLQRSRIVTDGVWDAFEEYQTLNVRISDHATAYCTEDVSLVTGGDGSGDDHTLDQLAAILAGPFVAD